MYFSDERYVNYSRYINMLYSAESKSYEVARPVRMAAVRRGYKSRLQTVHAVRAFKNIERLMGKE